MMHIYHLIPDDWNYEDGGPIICCPTCGVKWFDGFNTQECPHLLFRWSDIAGFDPYGDWDIRSFEKAYKQAYQIAHPETEKPSMDYIDLDALEEMKLDEDIEIGVYEGSGDGHCGYSTFKMLYGHRDK